jgi:hypothetical protein
MKSLLSLLLIFFGILTVSAQNIPNASFENWYNYSLGKYPNSWTTSDSISVANSGGISVFDGTDAYDGTKSLHLKSVQVTILIQIKGPGIATNGLISLNQSTFQFVFSGGSPDTARSRFLTGWYKYLPTNSGDAAVVQAYLFKNNGITRDTVAKGTMEISGTVSTYTQFVLQMNYLDFTVQPDTCLIILQSSRGLNDPNIGVGTEFIVDSLGFSGFVGIDELKNSVSDVKIFPSPADNELTIDVTLKYNISLTCDIYDLNGRLVYSAPMRSTKEKIDVSAFSAGRYILKIGDAKRNLLYSKKFTVSR